MKETDFNTAMERALFAEVQELRRDRDRLLRKVDAFEERANKLEEMLKLKTIRTESNRTLYGPPSIL